MRDDPPPREIVGTPPPESARGAGEAGWHRYLSTACYHEHHADCRLTCKWCGTRCRCACHKGAG